MTQIVEVGPKTDALKRAEKIVAQWLMNTWVERPAWMNRMPDREDIDSLVNGVARELEK